MLTVGGRTSSVSSRMEVCVFADVTLIPRTQAEACRIQATAQLPGDSLRCVWCLLRTQTGCVWCLLRTQTVCVFGVSERRRVRAEHRSVSVNTDSDALL